MGLKSIYSNNQVFQHLRNLHNHLAAVTSEPVGIFACCFHCCAQENNCNRFSYGILSTMESHASYMWEETGDDIFKGCNLGGFRVHFFILVKSKVLQCYRYMYV